MYESVLTDEKLDLYNVYEVHKNYRILVMAVNVPLQVAEEICHILNNFEPVILKTCPICDQEDIFLETYEPVLSVNKNMEIIKNIKEVSDVYFNNDKWNTYDGYCIETD